MTRGRLDDTYAASLQHDSADIPPDATRVGVVRRPTPWFNAVVDENRPAVAPPDELLDEVKTEHERLLEAGFDDAPAHNRALDAVDYDARYRSHLESPSAREVIEEIVARIESGSDVALVCYENTEKKRCHRTILREIIEGRISGGDTG
ncbi:MAG: DUF488 family protein [Halodesulfurarchaeum sp.]